MNRLVVVAALLVLPACAHSGASGVRWDYTGERGPERWSALAAEFAVCGAGRHQSPIDLTGAKPAKLPPLVIQYQPAKAVARDNGHFVQLDVTRGGTVSVGEHAYTLKHIDLHVPAEHAVGGERAELELQLVHADSAGSVAVVAVMVRAGAEHRSLGAVFAGLPAAQGETRSLAAPLDPSTLVPVDLQHFRYDGSLTSPPCTEGVSWVVLRSPLEVSESQLAALRARYSDRSRPLQPLGDRVIATDADADASN